MICSNVDQINLAYYYDIGRSLGRLALTSTTGERDASEQENYELWAVAVNAETLIRELLAAPWNLKVATASLTNFSQTLDVFYNNLSSTREATPATTMLLRHHRNSLVLRAQELQTVLLAELQTKAAYFVPQQGIYQTGDLIDRAEFTLPEETRSKLAPNVLNDLREAGRCLAFGVATASGFHMMRAVETVVWAYSQTVDVSGTVKKPSKSQTWGAYTKYLAKSSDAKVKEVHALLQQLKDNHRNLIMHPEKVLSPNDAFRLFEEGQSAIITVADRLPALPPATAYE